jgi:hypothetical protein
VSAIKGKAINADMARDAAAFCDQFVTVSAPTDSWGRLSSGSLGIEESVVRSEISRKP